MGGCATCILNEETKELAGSKSLGCQTGGCNKLNVFDWLADMDIQPGKEFDIVEVRFKNGRKSFFRNKNNLELHTGDAVVVEWSSHRLCIVAGRAGTPANEQKENKGR